MFYGRTPATALNGDDDAGGFISVKLWRPTHSGDAETNQRRSYPRYPDGGGVNENSGDGGGDDGGGHDGGGATRSLLKS